ncbi:MAG TPA: alpha-(1-_3)-arabinofuranosyltransferase family protein [Acidimicrobiales bacterium]
MPRARLAVTAALVAACFLQAPGRVVPETKLDLVVDPGRFLGRALHLWDAGAGFGRIGNQSAGYLLPMGPFHLAGDMLGVPAWVIQRAWFALLLVAALWGADRLLAALGIGTPGTRLLGAAAYALAPSFTAVVAFQSGGQVPHALLPWTVVPLVAGAAAGSPRRAAARSGLAVAVMGGVNGAATAAALVAPALFLATRRPGARRRRLAAWWVAAVGLATAWWLHPLLVQVAFGFDFTAYTETAATTTSTTSAVEVLRGTANWLGHLAVPGGRWLPGAWAVASEPVAVAATAGLAAAGLGGLAHRDGPERWWLALCAGVAAAGMAAGYAGAGGGPLAGVVRDVLDGPLAPFRNVTKLAPVLAIALAGGLAHGATVALGRLRLAHRAWAHRHAPRLLAAGLAAAVVVAALPLWSGRLAAPGSFDGIPGYWREAAAWLGDHAGGTVSLVVPSASFGEYRWGRPLDEPLQALARSPWAVRDLVPLGGAGSTRLMDAVGRLVDTGTPSAGLAPVLARSGVGFVVARNDLDRARTGAPPPAAVHRALAGSAGLERVAAFGPVVGRGLSAGRLDPALGPGTAALRAVEVWQVTADVRRVAVGAAPLAVAGGPGSLVPLAERGLLDGPVVLGGEGRPVATDSVARRDVDFGVVRGGAGPVLGAGVPADDLDVPGEAATTLDVEGGDVAASSAARPETAARAAVDGDPDSAWVPAGGVGEWVELRFGRREVASVTVRGAGGATSVLVDTAEGRAVARLDGDGPVGVDVPAGPTPFVRVTLAGAEGDGAGVAEVAVPGVRLAPVLVVPPPPAGGPAAFVLDRYRADPYDADRSDEETALHRRITVAEPSAVEVAATVVGVPGDDLDRLLAGSVSGAVAATASSTWRALPAFAPWAAVDGDEATSWVAAADDRDPAIELRWDGERAVDGLVVVAAGAPGSPVSSVVVEAGGRAQEAAVGDGGSVAIEPVTTDHLVLRVPSGGDRLVAVAEVRVPALEDLPAAVPDPAAPVEVGCDDGPVVRVDGRPVRLSVTATVADLVALRPVAATACDGPVDLDAGDHHVDTDPGGPLSVAGVTLAPPGWAAGGGGSAGRRLAVGRWDDEARRVSLTAGGDAVLALTENANDGWEAVAGGRELAPVVVDGWRQGWAVPAGVDGVVDVRMGPAAWYRWGLLAGVVLLAALVAAALAPSRRGSALPAAGRRPVPPWGALALAAGAGFLVGGPLALAVPVLVWLPERDRTLPVVAGASMLAAGLVVVLDPGRPPSAGAGSFGAAAQVLAGLALVAALAAAVPDTWRPTLPRRRR